MINNDELYNAILNYRQTGVKSEQLGKLIFDLHNDVLLHRNFNRYQVEVKEDMRSYSLERIMKRGLETFDLSRKTQCWTYYTHSVFLNYYVWLKTHYRNINREREFKVKHMNAMAAEFGKEQKFV